jgi:hypothetical protein
LLLFRTTEKLWGPMPAAIGPQAMDAKTRKRQDAIGALCGAASRR